MSESNQPEWTASPLGGFLFYPRYQITDSTLPVAIGASSNSDFVDELFSFRFVNGITMRVSRLGFFVFDFSEDSTANCPSGQLFADIDKHIKSRMRFMNLFLVHLYSVLNRESTPANEKMYVDDLTYIAVREDILDPRFGTMSAQQGALIERATKFHSHLVLSVDTIATAANLANESQQQNGELARLLADMLLHAFSLWQHHHYETAHVVAWTINEFCVNHLWESYLVDCAATRSAPDDRPFFNSTRRQKLNGRDFSASIITEILSLSGKIDFETYEKLNQVRQSRNHWLHKMTPVTAVDSCVSLNLAIAMLRVAALLNLEFTIPVISGVLLAFKPAE